MTQIAVVVAINLALFAPMLGLSSSPSPPPSPLATTTPSPAPYLFSKEDILTIVRGIFTPSLAQNIAVVMKPAGAMPAGDPIYHYVGRTSDGKLTIWRVSSGVAGSMTESEYWQATTAAYALAAVDAGDAGPIWQARFKSAVDPTELGHGFASAFQRMSDTTKENALDEIAWVHKTIVVGMSRTATYARLKKQGLIAYNGMYIAGKPIGANGCSYEDAEQGRWPRMNEPLPKSGCAFDSRDRKFVPNPDAFVDFNLGFTIGCSTDETLTLSFDMDDKLKSIKDSRALQTCL
jgi:hypothetical protein